MSCSGFPVWGAVWRLTNAVTFSIKWLCRCIYKQPQMSIMVRASLDDGLKENIPHICFFTTWLMLFGLFIINCAPLCLYFLLHFKSSNIQQLLCQLDRDYIAYFSAKQTVKYVYRHLLLWAGMSPPGVSLGLLRFCNKYLFLNNFTMSKLNDQ